MLTITVPVCELWDEAKQEFSYTKETVLKLEHSLISISKWEAIYRKPYLSSRKTPEEYVDYVRCMTITKNVDPSVYDYLTEDNIREIDKYLNDTPTATWFSDNVKEHGPPVTAEVIYYWMISNGLSKEFEKWNLNRLLVLLRVFSEKNKPKKKMSRNEILRRNSELNAARRAKFNTKG